jgi:hypothetical protein
MKIKTENLKLKIIITLLFTFCVLGSMFAQPAKAQNVDLGIYPPVFQIQSNPPSDIKIPFTLQNFTDSSIPLAISLRPFTAAETENGNISFTDTTNYPDPYLPQRIQVLDGDNSIGDITLSPQQKKDLTLEVQIPNNEPKGDYYLSLIFTSNSDTINNRTSSQATIGIASNILLSVGPVGKPSGQIEEFSTPFLVSKGPIPFTVRVKNASDHFVTPKGNIVIKNMFGQTIGKVNLLSVNLLANSIRKIPDSLQTNSATAIWPEKFLIGPYTATLTLALSDNGPLFTKDIVFFAFPLEYLTAILLIICLLIFIAVRIEKSRKKL